MSELTKGKGKVDHSGCNSLLPDSVTLDLNGSDDAGVLNAAARGIGPDSSFTYDHLEEDTIRVLRFRPDSTNKDLKLTLEHLHNYFEEETADFVALSYCWGDPARIHSIALNGTSLVITKSLWEALQALQAQDRHMSYWADAVCINQNDIEERNAQVQQMWRVYSSAKYVAAWLGPEEKRTKDLFALLRSFNPNSEDLSFSKITCETCDPNIGSKVARCIRCEARRSGLDERCIPGSTYFERTWISPELLQARRIIMACGPLTLRWNQFQMVAALRSIQSAKISRVSYFHDAIQQCKQRTGWDPDDPLERPFDDFVGIVDTYAPSRCTDPRDRVFALLSDPRVASLGHCSFLKVDYGLDLYQVYLLVLKQFVELMLRQPREFHEGYFARSSCISLDELVLDDHKASFASRLAQRLKPKKGTTYKGLLWCQLEDSDHIALCDASSTRIHPPMCEAIWRCLKTSPLVEQLGIALQPDWKSSSRQVSLDDDHERDGQDGWMLLE